MQENLREAERRIEEARRTQAESLDFEDFRLIQEFRHHVDDILVFVQDVLMPRNLEAHLGDGFQAVRDSLRRRTQASQR